MRSDRSSIPPLWTCPIRHVLAAILFAAPAGCAAPECADRDYRDAECRVLAENELAALDLGELAARFVEPGAADDGGWIAAGVLTRAAPDELRARVAAPGRFGLRLSGAGPLALVLDNVDPQAEVLARVGGVDTPIPPGAGLRRRAAIDLSPGTDVEILGARACPDRFRLAVVGDIQENRAQLERILARLGDERAAAEAAGEALVGLLLLGDISQHGRAEELAAARDLLGLGPVPVVVGVGNHDVSDASAPQFNRAFGPGNLAFSICSLRVAQLDSGDAALAPSIEARLPDLLDRGDARFHLVATHYPPYAGRTGGGWASERQAERLLVEAAIQGSDAVLAGHVHDILSFPAIPVGDRRVREYIVGTGGADQGAGLPRYGYLRLRFAGRMEACFVEVPPAGAGGPLQAPPDGVPACATP